MPVKRSLKLEAHSSTPSRITRTANYSPTTGTCQMSPFTSPTSAKEEHRNEPSNGKRRRFSHLNLMERKESTPQDNDEFMTILSKVEKSSDRVMEIMQNLNSIQALKGNRELENLIGISFTCCSLKKEMEKTKELMTKVMKQKLFEKKNTGLPHKELQHLDSYEFLKAALN
ncbi:centromere protein R isoform X1 [Ochotona curzoniae]|uniref:centromere protein R isoform X1 n=2 Tax=Ochotona curzoniae TaxID=130825 RepID=UPI001B34DD53|nr:centromere protein R isoform X1 [Ochotona curzoniae]